MGRVEMRQYRRRQGQAAAARIMLLLALLVVAYGLLTRPGAARMNVSRVSAPTATPVASVFDEASVTREVTGQARTWYALQTGVCVSQSDAGIRAQAYADRGAPGMVVQAGGGYHVLIAAYGQREDAASVQERLRLRQNVETDLYPWTCPEITLRLSGAAGQVDVAEAGLDMVLAAAEQLRDAASDLDRGAVTREDVLSMLTSQGMQFSTWKQATAARFDRPYPALVQAELALVGEWEQAEQTVRSASRSGATELSAAMKCQSIRLYDLVIAMRAGITDD